MRITRTRQNRRPAYSTPRIARLAQNSSNWRDPLPENLKNVDPHETKVSLECSHGGNRPEQAQIADPSTWYFDGSILTLGRCLMAQSTYPHRSEEHTSELQS